MKNLVSKVEVEIVNEWGLHARTATLFVKESQKYSSTIEVEIGDNYIANGKDISSLLLLAAEKGSILKLTATGLDSKEALLNLSNLIKSGFYE
ncbi:MAG: HPr family phosphocarrier protein [Nitrospinota bacterium]